MITFFLWLAGSDTRRTHIHSYTSLRPVNLYAVPPHDGTLSPTLACSNDARRHHIILYRNVISLVANGCAFVVTGMHISWAAWFHRVNVRTFLRARNWHGMPPFRHRQRRGPTTLIAKRRSAFLQNRCCCEDTPHMTLTLKTGFGMNVPESHRQLPLLRYAQ